jgi:hypothetical protein
MLDELSITMIGLDVTVDETNLQDFGHGGVGSKFQSGGQRSPLCLSRVRILNW